MPNDTEFDDIQGKKLNTSFRELPGDDGCAEVSEQREWHEMDARKRPVELATEVRSVRSP